MWRGFWKDIRRSVPRTEPSTTTVVLTCVAIWLPPVWVLALAHYCGDVGVRMGIDNASDVLLEHLKKDDVWQR